MSYTPTEWKTGDVITAERLNKAEQGIKDAHDNAADISSEISTEVASWLDEHVNVTEGVNIDDSLSVSGSAADAKATGDKVNDLKSAFDAVLVEKSAGQEPEEVTLTTILDASNFGTGSNCLSRDAAVDDVVTFYVRQNNAEKTLSCYRILDAGNGKFLVAFKYRIRKIDSDLSDPDNVGVILGTSTRYDNADYTYNNWISFCEVVEVDLTRVYFTLRNFAVAPAYGQIFIDVSEIYCYDVSNCSDEMISYIIEQQSSDYKSGTVTYTIGGSQTEYVPDDTLTLGGKAADSKATGDAIAATNSALGEIGSTLFITETATLTNQRNVSNISPTYGLKRDSVADGIVNFSPSSTPDKNPTVRDSCNLGVGKWLIGFKYKLTKLDETLGNPSYIRIGLGASDFFNSVPVWDEWVPMYFIHSTDLTRVQFAAYGFPAAPTAGQLLIQIKDYYIYSVDALSDNLLEYVKNKQVIDFTDGTADYVLQSISPKLLSKPLNVTEYGIANDGITDCTNTLRSLFATHSGAFYFPAGTYKITGTVEIPAASSITGDGDSTVISMVSCDDLMQCVFRGTEKVYPYLLAQHDNVSFSGFKLIGNSTLLQQRHAGICIMDCKCCTVENVSVYDINYDPNQDNDAIVSGYGICVTRSQYVEVSRCRVERCGYECIGVVDNCNHCTVRDCYTQDGWRTCIQVHRGSKNTLIDNCYMKQTHTKYDACFTVHGLGDGLEADNLRVLNCTAEMTANGAQALFYCAPYQIMGYAKSFWFAGNKAVGGKRALYISNSCDKCRVVGNDLACNSDSDYGIRIESAAAIISGNILVNDAASPVNVIDSSAIITGNVGID